MAAETVRNTGSEVGAAAAKGVNGRAGPVRRFMSPHSGPGLASAQASVRRGCSGTILFLRETYRGSWLAPSAFAPSVPDPPNSGSSSDDPRRPRARSGMEPPIAGTPCFRRASRHSANASDTLPPCVPRSATPPTGRSAAAVVGPIQVPSPAQTTHASAPPAPLCRLTLECDIYIMMSCFIWR